MKVYMVYDTNPTDGYILQYGVYTTKDKAEARLAELESSNNEYGEAMDGLDIIELSVQE